MSATRKEERPRTPVKTPAAERILCTASELFYWKGIRAVGVDAIAAEADVTKKTLYERFGSKGELVAAYLRARDDRYRSWMVEVVEQRGGSAKERLLSTLDALGEWIDCGNSRGCGFVNAAVELKEDDHPARVVVMDQKRWLRDYFAELAAEAGAKDPENLAEQLLILHEGVSVVNSLEMPQNAAQSARQSAETLVANL
jgi:AcrR family transcriptional regulator